MLDDYKNNSFYEYAKKLDKFYHAYIFEVDDIEESKKIILSFAKMIICKNHYTDTKYCGNCNICRLIDNSSFSDLKIIKPDGISIKKEQILNMQKELSLKSINNNNRVYIIEQADKMNQSASNSLLKFLEEPEDGIYGILITNDLHQLLETIISRCILLSLKTKKEIEYDEIEFEAVCNFLKKIFEDMEKNISYLKQDFFKYFSTREEILKSFDIMEVVLDYLICSNYHIKSLLNSKFYDIINTNLYNFSLSNVIHYLDNVIIYKNKLINCSTLNLNLFMERFIIDLTGVIK